MKEIYHCTPDALDNVSETALEMHRGFIMAERKQEQIEQKRSEQKTKRPKL